MSGWGGTGARRGESASREEKNATNRDPPREDRITIHPLLPEVPRRPGPPRPGAPVRAGGREECIGWPYILLPRSSQAPQRPEARATQSPHASQKLPPLAQRSPCMVRAKSRRPARASAVPPSLQSQAPMIAPMLTPTAQLGTNDASARARQAPRRAAPRASPPARMRLNRPEVFCCAVWVETEAGSPEPGGEGGIVDPRQVIGQARGDREGNDLRDSV